MMTFEHKCISSQCDYTCWENKCLEEDALLQSVIITVHYGAKEP